MKKYFQSLGYKEFMSIGFALFFIGIFVAIILDKGLIFEIIGIVLLIFSSAAFGASIRAKDRPKK